MNPRNYTRLRLALAALVFTVFALILGPVAALAAAASTALINPFSVALVGVGSYPALNAQTKASILSTSANGQQIGWEKEVIQLAEQDSAFADNMTGPLGSGKPFTVKNGLEKLPGQEIVINTVTGIGGRGVNGGGDRAGNEDGLTPGDFKLKVGLHWFGLAITNDGKAFTSIGDHWEDIAKVELKNRIARKQSDDKMMVLRAGASTDTTFYPNGKTLDTLESSDTFSTGVIVEASGLLSDMGGRPMNLRRAAETANSPLAAPIPAYMFFGPEALFRPIKEESNYSLAITNAKERGDKNPLFTGEYSMYDGNVIYPWRNWSTGAARTLGSALQPEAKLGTAIAARTTTTTLPVGGLDGGGSAAFAALTSVDWFEFFSLFTYTPCNGITLTVGSGTRFFAIKHNGGADHGKISFFSYTGNTGRTLTGLTRLGSAIAGGYHTTVGAVTWNTGVWTMAASGDGFLGVSDGIIPIGSHIYETNAKGQPIGEAFVLGEMAAVCGYGRIPIEGGFKTMAHRKDNIAPYNQHFGKGMEICHGTATFKRPDGIAPNFARIVMARKVSGFPVVV
jgi:hypothetical protein